MTCQVTSDTCQLYQPVSTDTSTIYRLSFYLIQTGASPPNPYGYFTVVFGLNSQRGGQNVPIPGAAELLPSGVAASWTLYTIDAPGDGSSDLVSFTGTGAAGAWGIDSVSLVAIGYVKPRSVGKFYG